MRARHRLTAVAVRAAGAGLHPDGGGLYLKVGPGGGKAWVLRYMLRGRARWMGLGPLDLVSLAEARQRATAAHKLLLDGQDPIESRRAGQQAAGIIFQDCADRYIKAHRAGWKNAKHADQWANTLATYAYPVLGALPVATIDTGRVLAVLEPLWSTKAETATRVRQRIEAVLDWARARGYRDTENPARWKGHLDKLLPRRSKVAPVEHHPALPWADLPTFYRALAAMPGTGALALRWTILAAARSGETLGATWTEIDETAATWTVPGKRMKAGRDHRVPLASEALAVLAAVRHPDHGEHIFETDRGKSPSNALMAAVLRRMGRQDLTVHGFRSTFRDWAGEATAHPRELAEAALAHTIKDKAEAAYSRGDALARRRQLMADWAAYCTGGPQP